MTPIRESFLLVSAIAMVYAAARVWRRGAGGDLRNKYSCFRPRIGFTQLDGMESLSLVLGNGSQDIVWVEEIEIFLSGLNAEEQACQAPCHEIQKIRQAVGEGDMVPISLAGSIYKAAGTPQRKYSCVLSTVLRYRIGEEWFENKMDDYKIRMIGLRGFSIQREFKAVQRSRIQDESQDAPAMALKLK
jgi:hypothetical protein